MCTSFSLGAQRRSQRPALAPYAGKTGRIGIASLGAFAASSNPAARMIAVSGAPLALNAQTAKTLSEAFDQGKKTSGRAKRWGRSVSRRRGSRGDLGRLAALVLPCKPLYS